MTKECFSSSSSSSRPDSFFWSPVAAARCTSCSTTCPINENSAQVHMHNNVSTAISPILDVVEKSKIYSTWTSMEFFINPWFFFIFLVQDEIISNPFSFTCPTCKHQTKEKCPTRPPWVSQPRQGHTIATPLHSPQAAPTRLPKSCSNNNNVNITTLP